MSHRVVGWQALALLGVVLVLTGVVVGSGPGSALALLGMLLLGLTTVWHIDSRAKHG